MKILIASVALVASGLPAKASTAAAWRASDRAAQAACIKAANFARPSVSAPLNFSDQVGRDAVLVRGMYKQRFMKNAWGTMLCLYDRRTRRAEVSEAKGWSYR